MSPEYEATVLARNKSAVYASLNWLHEHQAISDEDLKTFELLKKTRNLLAHQLFEIVTGCTITAFRKARGPGKSNIIYG